MRRLEFQLNSGYPLIAFSIGIQLQNFSRRFKPAQMYVQPTYAEPKENLLIVSEGFFTSTSSFSCAIRQEIDAKL